MNPGLQGQVKDPMLCQAISRGRIDGFQLVFGDKAKENMAEQPCTKVSYLDHNSRFFTVNKQHIIYRMNFVNPHKMTVYKEFLIFDLVGMVSAIGGTMGLCIGLSFTELLSLLLRLVEKVWTHTRN